MILNKIYFVDNFFINKAIKKETFYHYTTFKI